ncbi:MFS transporter [Pseudonocardia eucalypti]|uniref:MFS transporter n=2 Tax=Pseudonocardia eucalypti TaxID=648755 RepID=A0ABP9PG57_9PSEU
MALNFADKSVIGLAAPPMMADLGLTATEYGTIASSFYLLFSVSAIAFGFLGNRFSGKWLLAGLAVVWSVAQLPVMIPAAGFAVLLITRVLLGAGEGPGLPLGVHNAFTWVPPKSRGLTAALLTVGSALGVIVGAPLLNAAIHGLGWRSAFGILGLLGLMWVAAWLLVGGDGPYAERGRPPAGGEAGIGTGGAAAGWPPTYRAMLGTGTWLGTLASGFAVYWGLAVAIAFLPLYFGKVGYGPTTIGFLVTFPAYLSAAGMLLGGWLSQRLIKRGVSRHLAQGMFGGAFAVISGLSMLGMTRFDSPWLALPLAALAFGVGNSQTPLSQAAVADTVPARRRGAVLGLWYALVSTASIVAPTVTGMLVDAAPVPLVGYGWAFDLAGAMAVVGGLIAVFVVRPDRDAARIGGDAPAREPAQAA